MSELYWRKSEDCGLWAAAIDNAGVSAGGVCSAVAPPVPPPPLVLGSPGEHFNEYYAGNDSDSDGTCSPWVSWPPYSESDRIEIRCEKELAPPFRVARRLSSLYSPYRELRLLHASVGGVPRSKRHFLSPRAKPCSSIFGLRLAVGAGVGVGSGF